MGFRFIRFGVFVSIDSFLLYFVTASRNVITWGLSGGGSLSMFTLVIKPMVLASRCFAVAGREYVYFVDIVDSFRWFLSDIAVLADNGLVGFYCRDSLLALN